MCYTFFQMFFTVATPKLCCFGVVVLNFECISRLFLLCPFLTFSTISIQHKFNKVRSFYRSGVRMVLDFVKGKRNLKLLTGDAKERGSSRENQP